LRYQERPTTERSITDKKFKGVILKKLVPFE